MGSWSPPCSTATRRGSSLGPEPGYLLSEDEMDTTAADLGPSVSSRAEEPRVPTRLYGEKVGGLRGARSQGRGQRARQSPSRPGGEDHGLQPSPAAGPGASAPPSAPAATLEPQRKPQAPRAGPSRHPDAGTPASPSGSQNRRRVAGRFSNFITKHLCFRLPGKKRHSKVSPG
eukprot:XP_028334556.1 uncharacterized protein LOC114484190 [Physeter catodon]